MNFDFKHIHLIVYHRHSVSLNKSLKSQSRSCKNAKQKETWQRTSHLRKVFPSISLLTCACSNFSLPRHMVIKFIKIMGPGLILYSLLTRSMKQIDKQNNVRSQTTLPIANQKNSLYASPMPVFKETSFHLQITLCFKSQLRLTESSSFKILFYLLED